MIAEKVIGLSLLYVLLSQGIGFVYCANTEIAIVNPEIKENFEQIDLSKFKREFTSEELKKAFEFEDVLRKLLNFAIKLQEKNQALEEELKQLKALTENGGVNKTKILDSEENEVDSIEIVEEGTTKGEQKIRVSKNNKGKKVKKESTPSEKNNEKTDTIVEQIEYTKSDGTTETIEVHETPKKGHTHKLKCVNK